MFRKKVRVGKADVVKEVTDWGAVFGFLFMLFIVFGIIGTVTG